MTDNQQNKGMLKILARGAYDTQQLRIQMGNRVVANFRSKLGLQPSDSEEQLDLEGKEILKELRANYDRIADAMGAMSKKKFKGDGVISSYTEFSLLAQYFELDESEKQHFKRLKGVLTDFPIFTEFLDGVKGVGPAMAAVIISEIDIHKARHASSIWKYAGLDVGPDGRGRSRRGEHLVKVAYEDKDGAQQERNSITFNPFLKTKLIGVLGGSFLKSKSPYAEIYYNTKNRLENHAVYKDVSKGHRHNMAIRKMVKLFLVDLYTKWRTLEGLPVSAPYAEAKLGLKHGSESFM